MTVPVPSTPSDIITLALKTANVVGVGQTPEAEDMNDAFNLLNMLLAQLQRRRYFIYQLITTGYQATGALSYTVGPGGNFNIPRPGKIESAFFRQNQNTPLPVDYPLEIIRAREDYNRISIKNLNAFPRYAFYDAAYPVGNLFIWPLPNAQYQIFITTMLQLQQFATISDTLALPPEYSAALMWNLVLELYPFYGLPENPITRGKAEASLRIIEESNAQIPQLQMPTALRGQNTGTYNIYGDQYIGSSP
ncbi:hypothetical protein [Paraburkholderia sacchari]|uniref:phage adaptor protein n=1 Tax=Paraburkholderia sacchari TaxID=159450 RepID=UPI003D952624